MIDRQERRRFFRIEDHVGLSYRLLDDALAQQQEVHDAVSLQITPVQMLERIDKELTTALSGLWKSNPSLANVMGLLNKKIDVLVAELNPEYNAGDDNENTVSVNLSACGIAFECGESFVPGQKLVLDLTLRPTRVQLSVIGRVVVCESTPTGSKEPYVLRLNFDEIDAATQEELIQHVVRRQSFLLGQQRTDQGEDDPQQPENIQS